MKKSINVLLTVLFVFSGLSANEAEEFSLPQKKLELISQNSSRIILRWEAGNYRFSEKERNGSTVNILTIEGLSNEADPGEPALPTVNQLIAIPAQGRVTVRVNPLEEITFSDKWIPPAQLNYEDGSESENYQIKSDVYNSDRDFPHNLISESSPVIIRDLRALPLNFYPARFNPMKREVTLCTKAEIEIEISPEPGINEKSLPVNQVSEAFLPLYESLITGAGEFLRDAEVTRGGYLIIAGDGYITNLQSFVQWKRELGYPVTLVPVSQAGSSTNSIKSYIQNFYQNADPKPDYLLFFGDVDGSNAIPTFFYNSDATDLDYVLLEGNDYFPEMLYGRISVDTPLEALVIANKIVGYEKSPYMQDLGWFRRGLNVCSYYHAHSILYLMRWVRNLALSSGFNHIDTVYYPAQSNANNVPVYVNQGLSFLNYRGWAGSSGWYEPDYHVQDIDPDLNNGWKLPIVTSVVCGTANYASYTDPCFAEEWMRVGTPTTPKGAVAYFGCSEFNQNVRFANIIDAGLYWGILQEGIRTMGAATLRSKMEAYRGFPNYQAPGNTLEFYFHIYQLMGDPGMRIWVGPPLQMSVTHPAEINLNMQDIIVDVNSGGNFPVRNAYVSLYQSGGFRASGYVNDNGRIALPLDGLNPGQATLTVSKDNYQPFQIILDVAGGDYVGVESFTVIDTAEGSNNNNFADAGETFGLQIVAHNYSVDSLQGLQGTLTTNDSRVNILSNTQLFGNVGGGSLDTVETPFLVSIDAQVPGNTQIPLRLEFTDNNGDSWESSLILIVGGFNLELLSVEIDDDGNDGNLGPGETGELIPEIYNAGTFGINGMVLMLVPEDTGITLLDNNIILPPLAPGESMTLSDDPFIIAINNSVFPGTPLNFRIEAWNGADMIASFNFEHSSGYPQIDDPGGPDPYGYYVFDDGDLTYSKVPYYNWVEIDANLGGAGTQVPLSDYSEDDDDNAYVGLPFNVKFYGQQYSGITICSNGWFAFGHTSMVNARNWDIPSALAPDALVAPFWDDLIMSSSNPQGKVWTYHDTDNHTFIVEWSNLKNEYSTNYRETFQVIIYDPNYYPTPTGDAEMVFQYKEVHNIDSFNNYATAGIMHPSHQFGSKYTYANQYPVTSKHLANGLAVRYTTDPGSRIEPPSVACYPNEFDIMTPPGGQTEHSFVIANTGGGQLIYNATVQYPSDIQGSPLTWSGGPDDFGYFWIDSDDENGPDYYWVDISDSANLISFSNNDEAQGPFPIGFNFPFYGAIYNQFIINPNGWIGFGADNTAWENIPIPNSAAPRPAVFAYWDDLDPISGGHVYYHSDANRLVVWFNDVIHFPGSHSGTYDFQIIIYPNGKIRIQYRNVEGETNLGTIGIQNTTGLIGLQVAYNEPYIHDNLTLDFYPPQSWLTLLNTSGNLSTGEQDTIFFYVDGSDIEQSAFAEIIVNNNSESSPHYHIPVNVSIGSFGDVNFDGHIDVIDVVRIVNFVLDIATPTPAEASAADVNRDGHIDVQDIVTVINMILE